MPPGVARAGDARDGAGIEGEKRRSHRLGNGDRAARALGDLQRVAVAEIGGAPVHAREIAGHQRADVGVERDRRGALVLAPLGHKLRRAGDEEVRRDALDHRLDPLLVLGREEGPEEADRERLHAVCDQSVDRLLSLLLIQFDHHLAEAVHPLRHAFDQVLGHDGVGLAALRDVDDEADVAAGEPARAPHDVDNVVVALGGDEPDLGAPLLDDRVGADRGAVGQHRKLAAQHVKRPPELAGDDVEGGDQPFAEVGRRGGRLASGNAAGLVHHHAVGEGAADVDAAEIRAHGSSWGRSWWVRGCQSKSATALVQPPEAALILQGKHATVKPKGGSSSRCLSFSMWQ